jgi:hypothetical protein
MCSWYVGYRITPVDVFSKADPGGDDLSAKMTRWFREFHAVDVCRVLITRTIWAKAIAACVRRMGEAM